MHRLCLTGPWLPQRVFIACDHQGVICTWGCRRGPGRRGSASCCSRAPWLMRRAAGAAAMPRPRAAPTRRCMMRSARRRGTAASAATGRSTRGGGTAAEHRRSGLCNLGTRWPVIFAGCVSALCGTEVVCIVACAVTARPFSLLSGAPRLL